MKIKFIGLTKETYSKAGKHKVNLTVNPSDVLDSNEIGKEIADILVRSGKFVEVKASRKKKEVIEEEVINGSIEGI